MKSGSYSSWVAATPHEARPGGERDDDGPSPAQHYSAAADDALAQMRQWMSDRNLAASDLPTVWDFPRDAPIWKAGLSLAQAEWVHVMLRLKGGPQ